VGARPGLEDCDRPAEFVAGPHVLEQDDVVGPCETPNSESCTRSKSWDTSWVISRLT
jgi:hypothetical protein